MPRPYPNRERRRPGHRPPDRHRDSPKAAQPGGFTPPGVDTLYHLGLPTLVGREKRDLFNVLARGLVAVFACGGAILGYSWIGPFGLILGLGGGLMAGVRVAVQGRFYRR